MEKQWYSIGLTLDNTFKVRYKHVTLIDIVYEEDDFFVIKLNGNPYIEKKDSKMFISNEFAAVEGGFNICGTHYGTIESAYEQAWIEFNEHINPKVKEVVEVPKFDI